MSIFSKKSEEYKVADLIININFDESKKKNKIIVETFCGAIPGLKSKKYSGQLRNVNINAGFQYDNLSDIQTRQMIDFLNKPTNIQINKYQYIIANHNVIGLEEFVIYGCLFYRDKKTAMYQITDFIVDSAFGKNHYKIDGMQFYGDKTTVYFNTDYSQDFLVTMNVKAKAYIYLNDREYILELLFDYDNFIVNYNDKERTLTQKNQIRDYGFEEKIRKEITNSGWIYKKKRGFVYTGNNISNDIASIAEFGIDVYTNSERKVSAGDFSNIRVSYELDWFNIKGNVKIDGESVDIGKLINLKKKKNKWVEYNGKVIFLPNVFNSKSIKTSRDEEPLKIAHDQISSAISIAHDLNNQPVLGIDQLIGYNNITYSIDPEIENKLRPYQLIGVKWLLSLHKNGFGGCLADDMGLGKTLQIIAYLSDKQMMDSNNLIVVPKTLLVNWEREIEKFSPQTTLYVYHGVNRDINAINKYKIVLSTYQTIVNDIECFKNKIFYNLIIDEAQYIKNSRSKAYNALKEINANTKLILTGTPIENNLAEFWGLMRLVNPGMFESYTQVIKNEKNAVEKIKLITSPFLLRRLKKDVLKDLPEKREQIVCIKMEQEQQVLYDRMLESIRHEINRKSVRFEIKSNSIMLNGLLYLQEICCHPQLLSKEYNGGCKESAKLELLIDLLKSLYLNGHKIIVFSRFTKMLRIIESKIVSEHMNYYYLDGKTKDRMDVIDKFEHSENGVFLVSLKAGGTGINLTSADTAIIYDPWWNPASERQAEDRIYRIGQKNNVMIYRLIMEGTIEEKIQQLQNEKKELSSQILDGHDVPVEMTIEIMEKLIFN